MIFNKKQFLDSMPPNFGNGKTDQELEILWLYHTLTVCQDHNHGVIGELNDKVKSLTTEVQALKKRLQI